MEEQLDRPWHERTNLCPHSDAERTLHGTWCTGEHLEKPGTKTSGKIYVKLVSILFCE